jgi:hypothetical protein
MELARHPAAQTMAAALLIAAPVAAAAALIDCSWPAQAMTPAVARPLAISAVP